MIFSTAVAFRSASNILISNRLWYAILVMQKMYFDLIQSNAASQFEGQFLEHANQSSEENILTFINELFTGLFVLIFRSFLASEAKKGTSQKRGAVRNRPFYTS